MLSWSNTAKLVIEYCSGSSLNNACMLTTIKSMIVKSNVISVVAVNKLDTFTSDFINLEMIKNIIDDITMPKITLNPGIMYSSTLTKFVNISLFGSLIPCSSVNVPDSDVVDINIHTMINSNTILKIMFTSHFGFSLNL